MNIYIHTYGRPDKQTTLDQLPESVKKMTWLVVQDREKDLYNKWHDQILVLPPHIQMLSPTRQWILEHAYSCDIDKIVLMDDDLTFSCRHTDTGTKLHKATPEDVVGMFMSLEKMLDNVVHCGISAREGNNHVETATRPIGRMMRVLGYKVNDVMEAKCRFDRIDTKQDFDMTLQLLRKGYPNQVIYNYAQNQAGSNVSGGCSSYRTQDVMNRCANELAELHPGLVKVVEKETKTSWGGGIRTDVRISWAKAYKESHA